MDAAVETRPAAPLTRTRLAGGCLAAGALLLAVTAALDPPTPAGGLPELLAHTAVHPARWTAWALCMTVTALVLLPGVAALSRVVPPGRGAALTVAGTCATGAGLVGMAVLGAAETYLPALTAGSLPVAPQTLAAAARLEDAPGLAVAFLLVLPGFYAGLPLLLWGLRRARALPLWVPVAATAGSAASWFASELPNPWEALCRVPVVVALLVTSRLLLRPHPSGAVPTRSREPVA